MPRRSVGRDSLTQTQQHRRRPLTMSWFVAQTMPVIVRCTGNACQSSLHRQCTVSITSEHYKYHQIACDVSEVLINVYQPAGGP